MELVINGVTVDIDGGSFSLEDVLEERSVVDVIVQDTTCSLLFEEGMPWALYDPDRATGILRFGGLIASSKEKIAEGTAGNAPAPYKLHTLTLHDNTDIAQKRTVAESYTNATCGDMLADLVEKYLKDEGIITRRAYRREQNQTDWNDPAAVLTHVVAGSDGTLKLAKQGTDFSHTDHLAADWNAGTFYEGCAGGVNGDTLGLQRFDTTMETYPAATFYTAGTLQGPTGSTYKEYWFGTTNSFDVRAKLTAINYVADFDMLVDVNLPSGGCDSGIVFRTTYWGNANATNAYCVSLTQTGGSFWKGSNSSTPASTTLTTWTNAHTAGTWYTLRVKMVGNVLNVWEGPAGGTLTQVITNYTDNTYSGAGYIGLRSWNGTGSTHGDFKYDNIRYQALWGYWDSPADSSAAAVVAGASAVGATATVPAGCTLGIKTQVDGSTFQTYTPGQGNVTNLPPGTALTGKALKVRLELHGTDYSADNSAVPAVSSTTKSVTSGYYGSGTRVSPALDLSPAEVGGSATLDWTPQLPGLPGVTTVSAETSLDGGATWQSAPAGSAIPNLALEPDPTIDPFDADTSAAYVAAGDGTYTTWTWDVDDSCLVVAGDGVGSNINSYRLRTDLGAYADAEVIADVTAADYLVLIARATADGATHYGLRLSDESGRFPTNNLALVRRSGGTTTVLATAELSWARGTYHRARLVVTGTTLEGWLDGAKVLSTTDATLTTAGYVGFRNCADTGQHAAATVQTAIFVPHGAALAGKNLLVRHTLATTDASLTPALHDATASVRSVYIQSGALVGTALFPYIKASAAIEQLAEASDYWSYIDEQFRLHFRGRKVWPAPFALTGSIMLDGTIEVTRTNPNYRNRQFVIGSTAMTDKQTEEYHGNGEARQFMVAFPVAKQPDCIRVNGVDKTVGIKGVDAAGTHQWYWSMSDAPNVLLQDDTEPLVTASDLWHIEYYGAFQQVVVAEDSAEVFRRQQLEGNRGTGYVDDVYAAPQATTKEAAFDIANSKLARYGVPGRILTFQTDVAGLRPGMMATVWLPEHGFHGEQLLVESVTWDEVGWDQAGATNTNHGQPGPWLRYSVKAITGPVDGTWTKVFADLSEQAPAYVESLNAGQNVAMATTHPESDTWTWTEDAPAPTVFACPVPADTLYPSDTLYPC